MAEPTPPPQAHQRHHQPSGRTPTTSSPSTSRRRATGARMDPRLWSMLPQRLIDRSLAFLPPPALCRMRSVCKYWYHLLSSRSFLELCNLLAPQWRWFLFLSKQTESFGFLFDPETDSWFNLPMPQIPQGFSVVASAGGLLCWSGDAGGHRALLVGNPLTRTVVSIPPLLRPRFLPSVGLVANTDTTSYEIVVAGDDLISPFAVKNLTTEVLFSETGVWQMGGALPRLCSLESGRMVHCNGFMYCMNYSPFSVLAYDLSCGIWIKIQAPMRRFLRWPSLVECNGRVLLVAGVEKSKLSVPKSVRVWALQGGQAWVELERMPQALYERVAAEGCTGFTCVGHGDSVVFITKSDEELLLFDAKQKVWRWLPRSPFMGAELREGLQGFAYDPRMGAWPATRAVVAQLQGSSSSSFGF